MPGKLPPKKPRRSRDFPKLPTIDFPESKPTSLPKPTKVAKVTPAPLAPAPNPAPTLPSLAPGSLAGVDGRTAERFRKGELPVESTLDLHGLTQKEAHTALGQWIERCHRSGKRCVLAITGKGTKGTGILKNSLPDWLNATSLRPLILAITQAQPRHGGSGAFYILLRRKR